MAGRIVILGLVVASAVAALCGLEGLQTNDPWFAAKSYRIAWMLQCATLLACAMKFWRWW